MFKGEFVQTVQNVLLETIITKKKLQLINMILII